MKHVDTTDFDGNERAVFNAMLRLCETNGDCHARYKVAEIVREAGPGGSRRDALVRLVGRGVLVVHADGREYSFARANNIKTQEAATHNQLVEFASDLNNWLPMRELPQKFPKFTYQQIKVMFWRKDGKPGLDRCAHMVGRTQYINHRLFGLWLAGQLPEQNGQ